VYIGKDGYFYITVGGRLKRYKPVACPECGTTDVEVVPYEGKYEVRCPYCDKSFYYDAVTHCPVCGELLTPDATYCPNCGTQLGDDVIAEESYLAPKEKAKVINIEHRLNSKYQKELKSLAERDHEVEPHKALKAFAEVILQRGLLKGAEKYVELVDGVVRFKDCGIEYRNGEFYRNGEKVEGEVIDKECWRDEIEEVMAMYGIYRSHLRRLRLEGKGRRGKALVQPDYPRGYQTDEITDARLKLAECLGVDEQIACSAYARAVALKVYGAQSPKCNGAKNACTNLDKIVKYALIELITEKGAPPVPPDVKALLLLSIYVEYATLRCEEGDAACKRRSKILQRAFEVMSQDREVYEKMVKLYQNVDRNVYSLALAVNSGIAVQNQVNSAV